uniref:Uncharacterized protein n=1 Tax=Ditylenchus dipsaci TaxID=166011 RepID=A0A915E3Y5_9BILA
MKNSRSNATVFTEIMLKKPYKQKPDSTQKVVHCYFVFEDSTSSFDEKLKFANAVLTTFIDPSNTNASTMSLKNEAIAEIGEAELRDSVKNLFDCLQTMEKFHEAVFGLRSCSFLIKQPDKTAAHFHKLTLHASGKFVAQLTAFLSSSKSNSEEESKQVIPSNILELVLESQRLVVAQLTKKKTSSEEDVGKIEQNVGKLKEYLQSLQ